MVTMCYLKTEINTKYYLNFHMDFLFFKSNVVFLLLQTFEKMAKINTIKTILMNSSNVLLKNSDKFKNIIAVFTGKFFKLRCSSFTVIWTKLLS